MEQEGSAQHWQQPTTLPEPNQFHPDPNILAIALSSKHAQYILRSFLKLQTK